MRKILNYVSLVFVLCLSSCSSNNSNVGLVKNDLASIIANGYVIRQSSYQDNKWNAIYEKDNNYKDAYKVELTMNQETFDRLFDLDTNEEDQLKQYNDIVTSIPDCKVSSMNDLLPDETEVFSFIGKTIDELEEAGYERTGFLYGENGFSVFADGPFYSLTVRTDENITDETIDDYSENDIRELVISDIEITGFSSYIFD